MYLTVKYLNYYNGGALGGFGQRPSIPGCARGPCSRPVCGRQRLYPSFHTKAYVFTPATDAADTVTRRFEQIFPNGTLEIY